MVRAVSGRAPVSAASARRPSVVGGDVLAGRQRGERGEAAVFAEAVLMEVDDGPAGERLEPGVAERHAAERRGGEVEAIAGLAERLCGGAVAVGSGRLAAAGEDDPEVGPGGVAAVGGPGGELEGAIGGTAVKRGKEAVDTAGRVALVDVEIVVEIAAGSAQAGGAAGNVEAADIAAEDHAG